jgi:integrase
MSRRRKRATRKRVGRVSYYQHHGSWYLYYREGAELVRRRIGLLEAEAAQLAAEVNAQLSAGSRSFLSFVPVTIGELRRSFLDDHEQVRHSSVATLRRYRTATLYLERFAVTKAPGHKAHELRAEEFVRWLRTLEVAPNGHPNAPRRRLREKGIRFVLNTCRSLYRFAARRRNLPPYCENPFSEIASLKVHEDETRPVFVFDQQTEQEFLEAADRWSFPIHFTLGKAGIRPGEAARLLIEDVDLDAGWLRVRGKPELGWRVKTRRERAVPLVNELVHVLRMTIGDRSAGPIFQRPRFRIAALAFADRSRGQMAVVCQERTRARERELCRPLSREEAVRLAETVWRDWGAIEADDIRRSFVRIARAIGRSDLTCPKSWRHTFATLLQDANVDPLIRQITMGHAPSRNGKDALGMTSVYTHTRPETQKREIERALRLWPNSLRLAEERAAFVGEFSTAGEGE